MSKKLATAVLVVGCLFALSGMRGPSKKPHTKDEVLMRMLRGEMSPRDIEDRVRKEGTDFQMTPEVESELRRAGGTDDLLGTLRDLTGTRDTPASPAIGAPTSQGEATDTYETIEQSVGAATVSITGFASAAFQMDPFFRQFFGDALAEMSKEEYQQSRRQLGSGFIISPDGYVVTNNHIVAHGRDFSVALPDKRTCDATVVGADPQTDIAMLKVSPVNLFHTGFGDSSALTLGDAVVVFGNPVSRGFTVSRGVVTGFGVTAPGQPQPWMEGLIQTDAPISPANSGGPLVNMRGQVVGINMAVVAPGVSGAIPSATLKQIVLELIKTGKVTDAPSFLAPASLEGTLRGVSVQDLTPQLRTQLGVPPPTCGVAVTGVDPNSSAGRAGLEAGVVIESVHRKSVLSVRGFSGLAAAKGDTLLRVNHEGVFAFVVISPTSVP